MFEIKNHLQSLKVLKEVYDFYETKEEKISDGRKKNGKIYGRNGFGIYC